MPFNLHTSSKVNGYILKLTYLPAIWGGNYLDSKSLFDPVIKIDTLLAYLALKN